MESKDSKESMRQVRYREEVKNDRDIKKEIVREIERTSKITKENVRKTKQKRDERRKVSVQMINNLK